jgi:electron transport complex protein RnfD
MKFTFRVSPNQRAKQSTQGIMRELTLGLLVVYLFSLAFYYVEYDMSYVTHALLLMATAVGTSLVVEVLWCLFLKKDIKKHMQSSFPWVTSIILALIVPISMTYYALAIGTIFAILIGKLLFGGFGQNIFNPAAVGRTVMLTAFAGSVAADLSTSATPISAIASRGWLITDAALASEFLDGFGGLSNLLLGWYPGALGETSALLILVVGAVLAIRGVLDWRIPVFYLGTIFALGGIIALVNGVGIWYPVYHVVAGGAAFGAVFMLTDPVTNPTSTTGRIIFAIGAAILTVLIRVQANLPGGVVYSIMLMNILTPTIERLTDGYPFEKAKKYAMYAGATFVVGALLIGGVATQMKTVAAADPEVEVPEENTPEVPVVTLGASIGIFSDKTEKVAGEVVDQSADGDVVTYKVSSKGYAILESTYENPEPNLFEVVLNTADQTVVSLVILEMKDTAGIGDKIDDPIFLDQFKGLSYASTDASVDAISNATVSAVSANRAVRAAIEAAKGGE